MSLKQVWKVKRLFVKIKDVIKGGLTCEIKGVRGFIPASQVSLSYVEDLTPYKGETLEVKVMEYDFLKTMWFYLQKLS